MTGRRPPSKSVSENVPNPESNPRHYLRLYFPMATAALFRAHILRHSLRFARGSATTTSGAHILRLCLRRVAVFFVLLLVVLCLDQH
jgi:hypothetical protein